MKRLLFITAFLPSIAFAQETYNPFESIGKTTEVVTLSNGRYKKVYGGDTVKRIGSVMFDVRTNKVVKFLAENDTTTGYQLKKEGDIATRFLSIDPHASRYPFLCPYVFVNNNPIMYIDPDGRDYGVFLQNDAQGRPQLVIVSNIYVASEAMGKDYNTTGNGNLQSTAFARVQSLARNINGATGLTYSYRDANNQIQNIPIVMQINVISQGEDGRVNANNQAASDPVGNSYRLRTLDGRGGTIRTTNGENMGGVFQNPQPDGSTANQEDMNAFVQSLIPVNGPNNQLNQQVITTALQQVDLLNPNPGNNPPPNSAPVRTGVSNTTNIVIDNNFKNGNIQGNYAPAGGAPSQTANQTQTTGTTF